MEACNWIVMVYKPSVDFLVTLNTVLPLCPAFWCILRAKKLNGEFDRLKSIYNPFQSSL